MERNGRTIAVGLGAPTLILLLLSVCLAVFAALSLTTAQAGRRQSERFAQAAREYYQAEREAEEALAALVDSMLFDLERRDPAAYREALLRLDSVGGLDLWAQDGQSHVLYHVPIRESARLEVELVLDPSDSPPYRVMRWQTVPLDWEAEEGPGLWQPPG